MRRNAWCHAQHCRLKDITWLVQVKRNSPEWVFGGTPYSNSRFFVFMFLCPYYVLFFKITWKFLTLKRLGGERCEFDRPFYDFSKNLFFKERVKPCFFGFFSEAVLQRCSYKKLIWKYAANLKKNTFQSNL